MNIHLNQNMAASTVHWKHINDSKEAHTDKTMNYVFFTYAGYKMNGIIANFSCISISYSVIFVLMGSSWQV